MLVLNIFLIGIMSENVTELFFNVEYILKINILECTEMCFTKNFYGIYEAKCVRIHSDYFLFSR